MSAASGCMDILSYRQLGEVFTSAMTGNAALLGLDIGQGNLLATSRNLAAFAGFVIGLALGAALLRLCRTEAGRSRAMTLILLTEEALLVAFAALWHFGAGPSSDRLLYGLIGISAVAMGMQSVAAHHIGFPGVTTTYFTGTLTKIVVGAVGRLASPSAEGRTAGGIGWPVSALLAYVTGAALTGLLESRPGPILAAAPALGLPALPAILIAIVLLIGLAEAALGPGRRTRELPPGP
jgi:uncharacterized membrane protein YoaK (UPF0700 family)